jgi:hypothetical protein
MIPRFHRVVSDSHRPLPPFAERVLRNIGSGLPRQSGLMLAARITLPHFSISSAISFSELSRRSRQRHAEVGETDLHLRIG